jgi:hypothetical protein
VYGKIFLFRPESLRHDSESLFHTSEVVLDYHSMAGDFGIFSDCESWIFRGFFFGVVHLIDVELTVPM